MNPDLLAVLPHTSKRISELARQQPDVLDLTVGESRFGPPPAVIDVLVEQLRRNGAAPSPYSAAAGELSLRHGVAEYVKRATNVGLDPTSEVLITHGAAEAIWLTVFALTPPGGSVLLGDPAYTLYERTIRALGRTPVRVASRPEQDGEMRAEDIERALTSRTKLLILNSPENPTGVVYRPSSIRALVDLCREAGVYIAHDEVFDFMTYGAKHLSALAASGDRRHVLSINSFSKRFGITGWRMGWLVADPSCMREIIKAHTFFSLACAAPLQAALGEALGAPETQELLRSRTAAFSAVMRTAEARLRELGFRTFAGTPRGGFYLFLDVTAALERLRASRPLRESYNFDSTVRSSGDLVAEILLKEYRVAVVPGSAFGRNGDPCIRISVAGSPEVVEGAIARLGQSPLQ